MPESATAIPPSTPEYSDQLTTDLDTLNDKFPQLPEDSRQILEAILKIRDLLKQAATPYKTDHIPAMDIMANDGDSISLATPSPQALSYAEGMSIESALYEGGNHLERTQKVKVQPGHELAEPKIVLSTRESEGLSWKLLSKEDREEKISITQRGFEISRSATTPALRRKNTKSLELRSPKTPLTKPIATLDSTPWENQIIEIAPNKHNAGKRTERSEASGTIDLITPEWGGGEHTLSVDNIEGQTLAKLLTLFHSRLVQAARQHRVNLPQEIINLPQKPST